MTISTLVVNYHEITLLLDFLQVLLFMVLYEDGVTFLPECGADKSISSLTVISPPHLWIHNDSMYVRFDGMRNTKTWSKSTLLLVGDIVLKCLLSGEVLKWLGRFETTSLI